jgi:HK97 family phage major capsid protein
MKPMHRQGARWFMNSTTTAVVRKMKDSDGRPLWVDSIAAGSPAMLLGFPVTTWEDMPAIAQNAYPIAFANLQEAYCIVDRLNLRLQVDPFTSRPYVNYYATKRVGGGLTNSDALKLLRVST